VGTGQIASVSPPAQNEKDSPAELKLEERRDPKSRLHHWAQFKGRSKPEFGGNRKKENMAGEH